MLRFEVGELVRMDCDGLTKFCQQRTAKRHKNTDQKEGEAGDGPGAQGKGMRCGRGGWFSNSMRVE